MRFQILKPAEQDIEPDVQRYAGWIRLLIWAGVFFLSLTFWAAAIVLFIKFWQ